MSFGVKVIKTMRPQCYSMLFRWRKLAAGLSRDIVYVYVMEAGCSGQHPVKWMWNSIIQGIPDNVSTKLVNRKIQRIHNRLNRGLSFTFFLVKKTSLNMFVPKLFSNSLWPPISFFKGDTYFLWWFLIVTLMFIHHLNFIYNYSIDIFYKKHFTCWRCTAEKF